MEKLRIDKPVLTINTIFHKSLAFNQIAEVLFDSLSPLNWEASWEHPMDRITEDDKDP